MPEKLGNGGNGPEKYDINTGKYIEDGVPNEYYDNPNETYNNFSSSSRTRNVFTLEELKNNFDKVFSDELINEISKLGFNYEIDVFSFKDGDKLQFVGLPNVIANIIFKNAKMKLVNKEEFERYEQIIKEKGSGFYVNEMYQDSEYDYFNPQNKNGVDSDSGYVKIYRGVSVNSDYWDNPKSEEDLKDILNTYVGKYPSNGLLSSGHYGAYIYATVKKNYAKDYADNIYEEENFYGHMMEMIVDTRKANVIELEDLDNLIENVKKDSSFFQKMRSFIYEKTKDEIKTNNVVNQVMSYIDEPSVLAMLLGYDAVSIYSGTGQGQFNLLNPAIAIVKDTWNNGGY